MKQESIYKDYVLMVLSSFQIMIAISHVIKPNNCILSYGRNPANIKKTKLSSTESF